MFVYVHVHVCSRRRALSLDRGRCSLRALLPSHIKLPVHMFRLALHGKQLAVEIRGVRTDGRYSEATASEWFRDDTRHHAAHSPCRANIAREFGVPTFAFYVPCMLERTFGCCTSPARVSRPRFMRDK